MIETKYFSISPGRYVRQALSLWLGTWWWIFLPIVGCIIAGLYDARFYIVALALIFVVYPGLMILIYFNYALRPEAAWSVLSHKIIFDDGVISIIYQNADDRPTPKPRTLKYSDVDSVEDTGNSIIMHLKSGKYDFMEIPAYALTNAEIKTLLGMFRISA